MYYLTLFGHYFFDLQHLVQLQYCLNRLDSLNIKDAVKSRNSVVHLYCISSKNNLFLHSTKVELFGFICINFLNDFSFYHFVTVTNITYQQFFAYKFGPCLVRPLQFDSLIYGSAERSFCICKIKIKIFIFIFITAPIKHFNDRPKKIASGKKTS